MLVADLMTPAPYTLRDDKRLLVAREIMDWGQFRHVPIVDAGGGLVGLVSRTDVLAASLSSERNDVARAERAQHLATVEVRDVMRTDVPVIDPRATAAAAATVMWREKVNCLPVVDGGRLVGLLTSHDLLRIVAGGELLTAASSARGR